MKIVKLLTLFAIVSIVYNIPIISNHSLLLERGNDLQEFFWPLYFYVKNHIITQHSLPFYNPLFLSGTPLISDPQAPLFYIFNILFLFLPIDFAFVASTILHHIGGGIGMYLVARHAFKFEEKSSIFSAIFYMLSTRWSGFIDAGHIGLIYAHTWLPFVLWSATMLAKKKILLWSMLYALFLSFLFFSHPTTFLIASIASALYLFVLIVMYKEKYMSGIFLMMISIFLSFGLIAIAFLPQLAWMPETNRKLLLINREIYPIWTSLKEFIIALFVPWINTLHLINSSDTEKWINIGIAFPLLALLGLRKVTLKTKILLVIVGIIVLLLSLNNATPFYDQLTHQNWLVYIRVTTRFWFIITLITSLLAGYAINKSTFNTFVKALVFFATIELLLLSWMKVGRPIIIDRKVAPHSVYKYIVQDEDKFRIFCTTRCFSQKDIAKYDLETIEGYSTLHQENYYKQAWGLTGAYWNYYTLTLPPIGSYKNETLMPDYKQLGEYNTKYIVSPYQITNPALILASEIDSFYIYKNNFYLSRVYDSEGKSVPTHSNNGNGVNINVSNFTGKNIIISEVYSPNWKAFDSSGEKVVIDETPIALSSIKVPDGTNTIIFKYIPTSFKLGKWLTIVTTILYIVYFSRYINLKHGKNYQ